MINGISHITLVVNNLEKTTHLLTYIFNAKEVYSSGKDTFSLSREKFFLINDLWIALMEGDPLPSKTYNHIAFQIDKKDFDMYSLKINELGLETKPSRNRIKGEGKSIYFYDYDNHLFELHTGTLQERLLRYKKLNN